jgi:hypothetical protein
MNLIFLSVDAVETQINGIFKTENIKIIQQ